MSQDLWSDYYRAGALPSSTDEFSPDARSRIERSWQTEFSALPPGARILDIGTGAGALASLAADTATAERPLRVDGIDLAELSAAPDLSRPHCPVTLTGAVRATRLPFADRAFDLVVSQFGLEYDDDFPAAVGEAERTSGDRLTLLVHAVDGVVVRQNAAIADQIQWLRTDLELVDALSRHVEQPAQDSADALTGIATAIQNRVKEEENPSFLLSLARDIGGFLSQPGTTEQRRAKLTEFDAALDQHARRMAALGRAARSQPQLNEAADLLRSRGWVEIQVSPQQSDGGRHLVGYWLRGRRSSTSTPWACSRPGPPPPGPRSSEIPANRPHRSQTGSRAHPSWASP